MTTPSQKKEKILAAAAKHGWMAGIYLPEIKELAEAGKIVKRTTYTKAGGNAVDRYFLA